MIDIKDHYNNIKNATSSIFEESLKEQNIDALSKSHNIIFELSIWLDVLKDRPEYKIYETASKEYQFSIMSLNSGFYSKSYSGLRFFLERTLVAILFSAQEIELKLWEIGERDTYWSEIMSENTGIFSTKFCRAFFPELKDEINHFKNLTSKVYRECSEYVHGNNSAIKKLPENLEYSEEIFSDWHKKAETVARIILFTLNLRYLKHLNAEDLKKLENVNSDNFNNIKPIIELY